MKSIIKVPITSRVFYGWFALIGVMLVLLVVGGSFVNSFGVFLPVICDEFGWSRAAVATALSLSVLAFGLPSPFFGALVARFGSRSNIVLGNFLAALGLAGMSLIQDVWQIYLLYILIGAGAGAGGYIASTTLISNWFIKKRSLVLGMFAGCSGLAGFVFPPLTTALIYAIGWRLSWLVLAGIVFVVAVLIGGLLLVRNRPEDMGLLPDGMVEPTFETETTINSSGKEGEQTVWKARQALRIPTTWLIGVFAAANTFAAGTMGAHQVAYLNDLGFDLMTAASTVSLMAASNVAGSLAFGSLALRYNMRHLAGTGFLFQLTAMTILLSTSSLTMIYVYAVFMGMATGSLMTAMPTFVSAYYGRVRYAKVMGVVFPFQVVAHAAGAMIAGLIYDTTAAYTSAFIIAIILGLIGLFCSFMARPPKPSALEVGYTRV
jgi:MFS family permease